MDLDVDVAIVSDLAFPGGTATGIANEIRALNRAGRRVALIDHESPMFRGKARPMNPKLAEVIREGMVTRAGFGDRVTAFITLLQNPRVFTDCHILTCTMSSSRVLIVAQHPPTDSRGWLYYDPWDIHRRIRSLFSCEPIWAPISNVCRQRFHLLWFNLPLLQEDWRHVIFIDDWGHHRVQPHERRIRMGRHSRPDPEKWPRNRKEILQIYPDDADFDIRILGVGQELKSLLGEIPGNWRTWRFGERDVPAFLSEIDFFVYYHHPHWVEAFGRNIAEAAAAGCVCVLPPYFQATFGDIAFYREAEDAVATVRDYHQRPEAFASASAAARERLDALFGPDAYIDRMIRTEQGDKPEIETVPRTIPTLQMIRRDLARGAYHSVRTMKRWKKRVKGKQRPAKQEVQPRAE